MKLPRIVLASASPRRAELLRKLGLDFEVVPSLAAEWENGHMTAWELARINAYRKALWVARERRKELVLGADTLVCLGTIIFGKPENMEEAQWMLEQLQGRNHEVVTGVCLMRLDPPRQHLFVETTEVTFRPLDSYQIRQYLELVHPLDKAGAYAIQENGEMLVQGISGSYSNVVGLPLERLEAELGGFDQVRQST